MTTLRQQLDQRCPNTRQIADLIPSALPEMQMLLDEGPSAESRGRLQRLMAALYELQVLLNEVRADPGG